MKIEIKNRWTAKVIFSHDCDNNTWRLTVEAAVKAGAYLADAHFAGVNLEGANFERTYLARANFKRANLSDANFKRANLSDANLAGANLARANFSEANLARASLSDANLAGAKIRDGITITKAPIQLFGLRWPVNIYDQHMQIGCEFHTHTEWAEFDDSHINVMDHSALKFWRTHKAALMALCDAHSATESSEDAA